MKKLILLFSLFASLTLSACPDCGGKCGESSPKALQMRQKALKRLPFKIKNVDEYLVIAEKDGGFLKDKDTFKKAWLENQVINNEDDILIFNDDLIILKMSECDCDKKKDISPLKEKVDEMSDISEEELFEKIRDRDNLSFKSRALYPKNSEECIENCDYLYNIGLLMVGNLPSKKCQVVVGTILTKMYTKGRHCCKSGNFFDACIQPLIDVVYVPWDCSIYND